MPDTQRQDRAPSWPPWVSRGEGPSTPERTIQPLCEFLASHGPSWAPVGLALPELVNVRESEDVRGVIARLFTSILVHSFSPASAPLFVDIASATEFRDPRLVGHADAVREAADVLREHVVDDEPHADPVLAAKARWRTQALKRAGAMKALMRAPARDLPSPPTRFDDEAL